jgi:hypothetical protein
MIVWIQQVGDVSDVGRKIIVHWSAQGQNVNRERDLAVVEVRVLENIETFGCSVGGWD